RPAMHRSKVVLPQPEGPSKQTSSPAWISRLTWSRAVKEPNCLCSPCMVKKAGLALIPRFRLVMNVMNVSMGVLYGGPMTVQRISVIRESDNLGFEFSQGERQHAGSGTKVLSRDGPLWLDYQGGPVAGYQPAHGHLASAATGEPLRG